MPIKDFPQGYFAEGQKLKTYFGRTLTVGRMIRKPDPDVAFCPCGLYEVTDGDDVLMLRCYPHALHTLHGSTYDSLVKYARRLSSQGPSSDKFIWPLDLALNAPLNESKSLCLLTKMIPDQYRMMIECRFRSFRVLVDACINLCTAIRELHNQGYCFNTFDDSSLCIDNSSGKVLFADFENIVPAGTQPYDFFFIPEMKYLAPELVRRESTCSSFSDRHTLAALIFELFFRVHPLEYMMVLKSPYFLNTPKEAERRYGTDPTFVMDEIGRLDEDERERVASRDHAGLLALWDELPQYMREMFNRAFSHEALCGQKARPTELEWMRALARLRSDILTCSCGKEVFTDGGKPTTCRICGKRIYSERALQLSGYRILLERGTRLYACQLENSLQGDPSAVVAMGGRSKDGKHLGMANVSEEAWSVALPNGDVRKLEPRRCMLANKDAVIDIHGERVSIVSNQDVEVRTNSPEKGPAANIEAQEFGVSENVSTTVDGEAVRKEDGLSPANQQDEASVDTTAAAEGCPELSIYLVIDTSGQMKRRGRIYYASVAIDGALLSLCSLSKASGTLVKVAILRFGTTPYWYQENGPEDVLDIYNTGASLLSNAGGLACAGAALEEFDNMLIREGLAGMPKGSHSTAIVFLSGGFAADDYESQLCKLKENQRFIDAIKVGISFGDADQDMVVQIIGDSSAVVKTADVGMLIKLTRGLIENTARLAIESLETQVKVTGADVVDATINDIVRSYVVNKIDPSSLRVSTDGGDDPIL